MPGKGGKMRVPQGRLKTAFFSAVPAGLNGVNLCQTPAFKRRAIFRMSLRDAAFRLSKIEMRPSYLHSGWREAADEAPRGDHSRAKQALARSEERRVGE